MNHESKMAVRAKFQEIVQDYINDAGMHTVNISGPIREIQKSVDRWSEMTNENIIQVFDGGLAEIMLLIKQDSFRRFVRSDLFKKFEEDLKKESMNDALKVAAL
jgi:hypothetical protein